MNRHQEVFNKISDMLETEYDDCSFQEMCYELAKEIDELREVIRACAAGPWRYDVENAPELEWLSVWYLEHPRDWFKARLGVDGWETPLYKPTRTPDAFAVPNPPQVAP